MAYVRTGLSGLGVAPVVAGAVTKFGYSALKSILGTKPPEKPFPWRWDKGGAKVGDTTVMVEPGRFGIIYMTGYQFFRVWVGTVNEVFGVPGFDISGTIDDGKRAWRAYVIEGRIQLLEDFGKGWVPVFSGTKQQMIDWTGHVGPIRRPAVAVTAAPAIAPEAMPIVAAGFVPDLGGATMPLLIAAGLAVMFILKSR
jgi:hypothetical protein